MGIETDVKALATDLGRAVGTEGHKKPPVVTSWETRQRWTSSHLCRASAESYGSPRNIL